MNCQKYRFCFRLNLDLIEAIALGHDIGHTPFGHAGDRFLNELYHNETGRYFNHNVHSARVLDRMFARNITLQTHAFNVFTIYCYTNIIESRNITILLAAVNAVALTVFRAKIYYKHRDDEQKRRNNNTNGYCFSC